MAGCTSNSKDRSDSKASDVIGHFVFIDDEGVYHVDNDCPKLVDGKNSYGRSMYAMQPCDTSSLLISESNRFCAKCISITELEQLNAISKRNKDSLDNINRIIEETTDDRVWIYHKLLKGGYQMEPYDVFVKNISNIEKRRKLYAVALKHNWNVGTFSEFSKGLGFTDTE